MKETLQYLFEHNTLSVDLAKQAFKDLAEGRANAAQMAAFLTVYLMRIVTVEELEGFREAMLELCVPIDLSTYDPIDLCGTGGDGKDTFNISTLASFVLAGAGIHVAKHGNYGVSSSVGSSNILEHFGIKFTNNFEILSRQMEEANLCLLHAPLFHPAMKNIAPVRKEMGLKTFFNMLGPLVNPCRPNKQMVGVFNMELARLYDYLLQKSTKSYTIVHALDGYDEISLTGNISIISYQYKRIVKPEDLGFAEIVALEIASGGTLESSAKIFTQVLNNEATRSQKNVVVVNAAMAIKTAVPALTWEHAVARAIESIDSKLALQSFKKILTLN